MPTFITSGGSMKLAYRSQWVLASLIAALAAAGYGDDDGPTT